MTKYSPNSNMSNSLALYRNLAVCIGYHPSGWYPILIVWDTVAENLIVPHRIAPLAAAVGGVAQEGVKRTISENSKQCICGHKCPKPPIPAEAEMGGFLLVEAQPQSPETQDKSCGHAIFKSLCAERLSLLRFFFFFRFRNFHIQNPIDVGFCSL